MQWYLVVLMAAAAQGAPSSDRVWSLPGFETEFGPNGSALAFEVYSGYLSVDLSAESGVAYDSLRIHYEFHTCAALQSRCPIAVWHQGGPGGSSVFGAWTEMGPFQLMASGPVANLELAWNNAAHMLYLESPAGSEIADEGTGWSSCSINGSKQATCAWDDTTQAIAYAHTLKSFFGAYPEFVENATGLYLVGESYAGQYVPNIATCLLDRPDLAVKNLSGILVGNGCWGGNETHVRCNGPRAEATDVEMYYGKGLISKDLYDQIQATCDWSIPTAEDDDDGSIDVYGSACVDLLDAASDAIGPFNIYNVYDDCNLRPASALGAAREAMHVSAAYAAGYAWNCESDPALDAYFARDDVLAALHLERGSGSGFAYEQSGPASITLYPRLIKHMRVLIYNGDADLCVPYKGNEAWTTSIAAQGLATLKRTWHPWYASTNRSGTYAPAGYATTYHVLDRRYDNSSGGDDFAFLTIRLAGHMVPQYQPKPALDFFTRFLAFDSF